MHELILQLQQYHREKARHLYELEKVVNEFLENGPAGDYAQALHVLFDPFQSTGAANHHHNEELILAELRQSSAPIHRRVDEIPADHLAFNKIAFTISSMLQDDSIGCAELCSTMQNFIRIYDDHASGEEAIFFPIADKYLEVAHWDSIWKAWK